jgi:hypothetical protein
MTPEFEAPQGPSVGKWAWRACLTTVIGYGIIALTIHANLSTLFEYNGKISESNPRGVSGAEVAILLEFMILGILVGYLLLKAARARHRGGASLRHVFPIVIACGPLLTGLGAAAWSAVGAFLGPI